MEPDGLGSNSTTVCPTSCVTEGRLLTSLDLSFFIPKIGIKMLIESAS